MVYVLPPSESASHHNKMVAVQVLCGIAYKGLQSTESPDLWNISAKSFNTLSKWLKKNPQLMDPDVVSSTQGKINKYVFLISQTFFNLQFFVFHKLFLFFFRYSFSDADFSSPTSFK